MRRQHGAMIRDPLVSVLIRSIGRETLARSVAAALAQTHRPLEIVIVNAGTKPLPPFPSAGDVRVLVVREPGATRPHAANVALDHARGDWCIFLDDDDTFAPDHVRSLLDAAQRSGAAVAYSSTLCVDQYGRADMVVGAPFDRVHLVHGNYIQIGAALFAASLVALGARFDESLECLQDWDFWIQLAQLTHFEYTGKATNFWSAFMGASGAGMGSNGRAEVTAPFRERIARKWAAYGVALRGKVNYHREAARAAMSSGRVDSARRHLAAAAGLAAGPVAAEARRRKA